jgi:hypothetical protein
VVFPSRFHPSVVVFRVKLDCSKTGGSPCWLAAIIALHLKVLSICTQDYFHFEVSINPQFKN